MNYLKNVYKKIMGIDGENSVLIKKRGQQADDIKKDMIKSINKSAKKLDKINANTYEQLKQVSGDLKSITLKIAIASGGKSRGLKI